MQMTMNLLSCTNFFLIVYHDLKQSPLNFATVMIKDALFVRVFII